MFFRVLLYIGVTLFYLLLFPGGGEVFGEQLASKQWDATEITLTSAQTYPNPYLDMEVTAVFSGPGGLEKTVRGFWDGGNTFKVRFTPAASGSWTYSISSNPTDNGLTTSGSITVAPPGSNRGFVRVDPQYPSKFIYDNGEFYFMLGTTAYEYIDNAVDNFARWKDTIDHYAAHGINKVRLYVFPTDYNFYCQSGPRTDAQTYGMKYPDSRPFTGPVTNIDHDQLNIQHWQVLDEMVEYMASKGVIADLIMLNDPCYAKSYVTSDPNYIAVEDLRYMEYIVSRYAAYPNVIWCIVNEYYLSTWPPYGLNKPTHAGWNQFWNVMGTFVSNEDPWTQDSGRRRAISILGKNWKWYDDETNRSLPTEYEIPYFWFEFADYTWPTYAITEWDAHFISPPGCVTTGCGRYTPEEIPDWEAQRGVIKSIKHQGLPVVDDEFKYIGMDMQNGVPDSENARKAIWATYVAGAYYSIGDWFTAPGEENQGWGRRHMSSGDYVDDGEMKIAFDEIKILTDFFTTRGIEYWKMSTHNELVSGYDNFNHVYTLADPGYSYIIYAADGGAFDINLESGRTYNVKRLDPETGTDFDICSVSGGSQQFSTPVGKDWVYHVSMAAAETCILTNAYWSSPAAMEGESVQLTVEGTYCDGEELTLEVKEDDLFGGNNNALIQPQNILFNGDMATTTWISEHYPDGVSGDPEYYFIATLTSDANITIDSLSNNLLSVSEDLASPSIPQTLQATEISSVHIELSWGPSSDNVAVAGYNISRDGLYMSSTSGTSYMDSGLVPGTTYTYTVRAYDGVNNESADSTPDSATTKSLPDTTSIDYYCNNDNDGYVENSVTGSCTGGGCEPPGCQIRPGTDCNDNDQLIHPDASEIWYDGIDQNCDGKNDFDQDMDTYVEVNWNGQAGGTAPGTDDCDDTDAAINTGTAEIPYDGVDQDCSGSDHADTDGDGYDSLVVCSSDCNDSDLFIHPGATEDWYDGTDNNCDGRNDYDQDMDGYVDTTWNSEAGGSAPGTDDCDDTVAAVNPGTDEVWYDGADNNCDGKNDYDQDMDGYVDTAWNSEAGGSAPGTDDCNDTDPDIHTATIWYEDSDSDGYGNQSETLQQCSQPVGYVLDNTDCDDTVMAINPGTAEVWYDGADNNCDGKNDYDQDMDGYVDTAWNSEAGGSAPGADDCDDTDPNIHSATIWYEDSDFDGYGNQSVTSQQCSQPVGYVLDNTDCDTVMAINPGTAEVWYDGADNNCDGKNDYDQDMDGYVDTAWNSEAGGSAPGADDCDDTDPNIHSATIWYEDSDFDGYGNQSVTSQQCVQPSGYILDNTDCDDTSLAIHPGAAELCDNIDNDCDGASDDGFNIGIACEGTGECGSGILECADLMTTRCSTDPGGSADQSVQEICSDYLDNDCDGLIDVTDTISITSDQTLGGNPLDLTTIVNVSNAANVWYEVKSCVVNTGGTYVDAENYDHTTGIIVQGNSTTLTKEAVQGGGLGPEGEYLLSGGISAVINDGYQVNYTLDFPGPADTYYIWMRGYQTTSTVHMFWGMDDNWLGTLYNGNIYNQWAWGKNPWPDNNPIQISPGSHTFHFWARYPNIKFDGFYITTGTETPTDSSHGVEIDPNNCSTVLFSGDEIDAMNVDTTGWMDGVKHIEITGDDGVCSMSLPLEKGQFIFDSTCSNSYFRDIDEDGYGDPNNSTTACSQPVGYVLDNTDCDDTDININPATTWYEDSDIDSYGNPAVTLQQCTQPAGYVLDNTDCDDTDININPATTWYEDSDIDSYGNPAVTLQQCTQPAGYVLDNTDCDDSDININPATTWYEDSDTDSYGNLVVTLQQCTQPAGYVLDNTDCDDTDININPATSWYEDSDIDSYGNLAVTLQQCTQPAGYVLDNTDCDDTDININPATTWYEDSDIDSYGNLAVTLQQCTQPAGYVLDNTDCDDTDININPATSWYEDSDIDSYGNLAVTLQQCTQPAGYVLDNTDCDDTDININPATSWYEDTDTDTYGNLAVTLQQCTQPAGYVLDNTDCDDTDININPATTWYEDSDTDTYGNPAVTLQQCTQPAGYILDNTDCDDTNININPATTWYEDSDTDSYGNPTSTSQQCTQPAGYVLDNTDCDDTDININPATTWYEDSDIDSYGNLVVTLQQCTQPAGYVLDNTDCDDTDININPATTWYEDSDIDSYGNPAVTLQQCTQPAGYVLDNTDCDDSDININPATTWYEDSDTDSYGNLVVTLQQCTQPAGYVLDNTDCDDTDININPATSWYEDSDIDSYGNLAVTLQQCTQPAGYVLDNTDCDDTDININPATTWYEDSDIDSYGNLAVTLQQCTQPAGYMLDNTDCDDTDININPATSWYEDSDIDSYGNLAVTLQQCTQPAGYVLDNTDCDDTDININPATTWYEDSDTDTYGNPAVTLQQCTQPAGYILDNTDCDDTNININPATSWYEDSDTDSYGNPTSTSQQCTQPAGYVLDNTDCDDTNININPATTWYEDSDTDSYGDPTSTLQQCTQPTGYVLDNTDCDDTDININPATTWYEDSDTDSYGNTTSTSQQCTQPAGYVLDNTDCDDTDININPATSWYEDSDIDSYGNLAVTLQQCTQPAGYVLDNTDCDDTDININPATTWYEDSDIDSYGNLAVTLQQCTQPAGYVLDNTDCDDTDININPATSWYEDTDTDTYGNLAVTLQQCTQPAGYVLDNTDCDDTDININPATSWYEDTDTDTYGNPAVTLQQCTQPAGYVLDNTDCDDTDININPATSWYEDSDIDSYGNLAVTLQQCTQPAGYVLDNTDCDDTDININPATTWYEDSDIDSYGNPAVTLQQCTQPAGHVLDNTDCDDTDININPATTWYEDSDTDSYGNPTSTSQQCTQPAGYVLDNTDCDDTDININPATTWYEDSDTDSYGNPAVTLQQCTQPAGYVLDNTDCDDTDININPATTWYEDSDTDSYGNLVVTLQQCMQPAGYVQDNTDCDDTDININPATTWYEDSDTDSYGNLAVTLQQCTQPAGYVLDNTDCDDTDININPATSWYEDTDTDTYGNLAVTLQQCTQPAGYVQDNTDCDDTDININPATTWYEDSDTDSYGNLVVTLQQCTQPAGYVLNNTDCDDTDININPATTWYEDSDTDSYGNPTSTSQQCTQPAEYVLDNTDCDDTDININPETYWYPDTDGDGYGNPTISLQQCIQPAGFELDNTDCNDNDPFIYPGGLPVRIEAPLDYHMTLQDAYDASEEGDVIQIQEDTFPEDLMIDLNTSVVLESGHDCSYSTNTGISIMNGNVTISDGLLIFQSGEMEIK